MSREIGVERKLLSISIKSIEARKNPRVLMAKKVFICFFSLINSYLGIDRVSFTADLIAYGCVYKSSTIRVSFNSFK